MTWQVRGGVLYLFGYITLQWALQYGGQVTKDLDVAELWSGVGNVVGVARDNGHSAVEFDLDRVPGYTNAPGPSNEDITTEAGFLKALGLVLRLRPAAPSCFQIPRIARGRLATLTGMRHTRQCS